MNFCWIFLFAEGFNMSPQIPVRRSCPLGSFEPAAYPCSSLSNLHEMLTNYSLTRDLPGDALVLKYNIKVRKI